MRRETAGLVWGFLGVAAFSLTLPMTRIAVQSLDPLQVAIWRALVAALVAVVIVVLTRARRPQGIEFGYLALCASGTVFGFPVFTTLAMKTGSAAHGAVVVGLLPLATAVVGVTVNRERPGPVFWLSSLFGTAVTVAFVLRQSGGGFGPSDLYLLCAVASAAVGYAFGAKAAQSLGGWQVSCWALILALPIILMLSLTVPPIPLAAPPKVLMAFAYIALVSQLSGFFAWYRGLATGGIARVSQLQLLQLFLTVFAAWLLLGEHVGGATFGFGAFVVLSVWSGTGARSGYPGLRRRGSPAATVPAAGEIPDEVVDHGRRHR